MQWRPKEKSFEKLVKKKKYIYIYIYICFLGLHLQHMEAPRLRAESELQLLGYAMATAQDNTEFLTYLVSQELNPHPHGY